jgi:hypothetical protein
MFPQLVVALFAQPIPRLLWKFAWNFGVKGMLSVEAIQTADPQGRVFSAHSLYLSIINSCNLRCQGVLGRCGGGEGLYRFADAQSHHRGRKGAWKCLLRNSGRRTVHVSGIVRPAGGTRGTATFRYSPTASSSRKRTAKLLRKVGNATPLISIEGREITSDERRGRKEVFNRTLRGLDNCLRERILTGVATSLCQTNIDELVHGGVAA